MAAFLRILGRMRQVHGSWLWKYWELGREELSETQNMETRVCLSLALCQTLWNVLNAAIFCAHKCWSSSLSSHCVERLKTFVLIGLILRVFHEPIFSFFSPSASMVLPATQGYFTTFEGIKQKKRAEPCYTRNFQESDWANIDFS